MWQLHTFITSEPWDCASFTLLALWSIGIVAVFTFSTGAAGHRLVHQQVGVLSRRSARRLAGTLNGAWRRLATRQVPPGTF